jgi:hypothetical protein
MRNLRSRSATTAGSVGSDRRHRRCGGAPRAEFWVGLLGPRSVWRLHHAVDRGVAIGAGEVSSALPLGKRGCPGLSVLTRRAIDTTEVKFAGVIARSGISIAKSASTAKTRLVMSSEVRPMSRRLSSNPNSRSTERSRSKRWTIAAIFGSSSTASGGMGHFTSEGHRAAAAHLSVRRGARPRNGDGAPVALRHPAARTAKPQTPPPSSAGTRAPSRSTTTPSRRHKPGTVG